MTNVTIAFAKAMARANGWSLTDEGTLLSDGTPIGQLHAEADGYIANSEYMDLIERVRAGPPNQARLVPITPAPFLRMRWVFWALRSKPPRICAALSS